MSKFYKEFLNLLVEDAENGGLVDDTELEVGTPPREEQKQYRTARTARYEKMEEIAKRRAEREATSGGSSDIGKLTKILNYLANLFWQPRTKLRPFVMVDDKMIFVRTFGDNVTFDLINQKSPERLAFAVVPGSDDPKYKSFRIRLAGDDVNYRIENNNIIITGNKVVILNGDIKNTRDEITLRFKVVEEKLADISEFCSQLGSNGFRGISDIIDSVKSFNKNVSILLAFYKTVDDKASLIEVKGGTTEAHTEIERGSIYIYTGSKAESRTKTIKIPSSISFTPNQKSLVYKTNGAGRIMLTRSISGEPIMGDALKIMIKTATKKPLDIMKTTQVDF